MSRFKPDLFKNIISMLIVVVTILIGLFILSKLNDQPSNKIMIGGNFNLVDQNGNRYLSQNIKKNKVIYFGYTFCPDICPLDVLKISNFIEENKTLLSKTDFIFITVDPTGGGGRRVDSIPLFILRSHFLPLSNRFQTGHVQPRLRKRKARSRKSPSPVCQRRPLLRKFVCVRRSIEAHCIGKNPHVSDNEPKDFYCANPLLRCWFMSW